MARIEQFPAPPRPARRPLTRRQIRWRDRYGPWAVVTGASSGIGRALALQLAEAGLHTILVARRRDALDALAAEIAREHGVEARVVPADLATPAGLDAVEGACRDLDVGLYVGAAGFGTSGRFRDSDPARECEMLDLNCRALLLHGLHFGRRFEARGRGGLVLMASLLGFQGAPFAAHYAATKAYVQTLAEGLRVEFGPSGIDVLASAPGPVHTGFAATAGLTMGVAMRPETIARETLAALGRRTTVLPGALTKLLNLSLLPLPRAGRARIMGRVMAGMTKRHDGQDTHDHPIRDRATARPA